MARRKPSGSRVVAVALVLVALVALGSCSFIAVDLGTQSVKVMLMEGKTFDIVLNEQSGRKTDNAVGFTVDDERLIGSPCKSLMKKKPARVFTAPVELLGRGYGDPFVEATEKYRQYTLVNDEGAYGIVLDEETTFKPEELVAMQLRHVTKHADGVAKRGPIKDAVLVVPPFKTHHERQALINAAEIADLNVLTLINEGFAAAINYALIRDLGDDVDMSAVFYNVGDAHTSATLVKFKTTEDLKKNSTFLAVHTVATAWNDRLGGRDFDYRLVELILARARAQLGEEIFNDEVMYQRIVARLRQEAKKVKEVLSANQQSRVNIESLTPDHDFSTTITRAEFEEACDDLFSQLLDPITEVLETGNLTSAEVYAIELLGGGTRIPRLQADLLERFDREVLDKHLNGDEAMVYGASYFGATQSTLFRVTNPMKSRDATPFQHGVQFHGLDTPESSEDSDEEESDPVEYMTIIRSGTRFDAKKSLKLKQANPFSFDILYEESDAMPEGIPLLQSSYEISGFPENSTTTDIVGTPRVQIFFKLNPSGMVEVLRAEAEVSTVTYKKVPKITAEIPNIDDDSAAEDVILDTDAQEAAGDAAEESEGVPETDEHEEEEETDGPSGDDTDAATEEDVVEEEVNEEDVEEEAVEEKEIEYEIVPSKQNRHYDLKVTKVPVGLELSRAEIIAGKSLLRKLERQERERLENAEARNELEAFVYSTRELMYDEDIQKYSTEEERESISEQMMDAADWLYDEGEEASTTEYRRKLRELRGLLSGILLRQSEQVDLPAAKDILRQFVPLARNLTDDIVTVRNVTEEEYQEFVESLSEALAWLDEKEMEQDALQLFEDPILLSEQVTDRTERLSRQMKKLQRRPKKKVPKVEEPVVIETNETDEEPTEEEESGGQEPEFVFDLFGDADGDGDADADAASVGADAEAEQLLNEAENL